jgi:hypothetical protein
LKLETGKDAESSRVKAEGKTGPSSLAYALRRFNLRPLTGAGLHVLTGLQIFFRGATCLGVARRAKTEAPFHADAKQLHHANA